MYTTQIDIDLSGERRPVVVYAKQGDVSARRIDIGFIDNGTVYQIPNGVTARIWIKKPDGTAVYNDTTIVGNRVIADLTSQALMVAGDARAEIALYQGETLLSTSVFVIRIEHNARSESAAESSNEFGALQNLISQVEGKLDDINAAALAAIEIGGRNLLKNSENRKFVNYSGTTSTTEENITVAEWGATDAKRVYGTSGTNTLAMHIQTNSSDPTFLQNQDYVGSIYIKNNHATTAMTFCRMMNNDDKDHETVNPGESKRVSFLYNPQSQTNIFMQIHARCPAGSEFDFTYWHPQWEEGNKATSWAPAPEDKQDTITGAGTTVTSSNLTANRALISNGSGKIGAASVTATELSYLSGATSSLQTQLDQVNRDLGSVAEAVPSPFRIRLSSNGRGALICPDDGIYLLLVGCRHDSAVYMEAIVSKHPNVNGGAPKVTILKSAGMRVEATNNGGTIAVTATGVEDSLIRMCSIQFGSIT